MIFLGIDTRRTLDAITHPWRVVLFELNDKGQESWSALAIALPEQLDDGDDWLNMPSDPVYGSLLKGGDLQHAQNSIMKITATQPSYAMVRHEGSSILQGSKLNFINAPIIDEDPRGIGEEAGAEIHTMLLMEQFLRMKAKAA